MGDIKNHILQNEVYKPDSDIWNAVIAMFQIPMSFVNPPLVYTFLLNGAAAGARFKHFTIEALMIGHHKDDGTWWDLYKNRQVPGAITLSQRVFYHKQLPTRKNTELRSLQIPDCLFIQQLRMRFTPKTNLSIEGIETIHPNKQIEEVGRILLGLELFHPSAQANFQDAINKSGRPEGSGRLDNISPQQMEKILTHLCAYHKFRSDKQQLLADYFNVSRWTIGRYFLSCNRNWSETLRKAKAQATSLPQDSYKQWQLAYDEGENPIDF